MSTVSCSSRPGRNGPGLVQAAAFEFESTAARAKFVAAGFGVGAADGLCSIVHFGRYRLCRIVRRGLCGLCRVVHEGRLGLCGAACLRSRGLGLGLRLVDGDLLDVDDHLLFGCRRCGGQVDDRECGFQAGGGGGFGVGKEVVQGLDGEVDLGFDLFAEVERATVLGVSEGLLEGEVIAPPVVDGVAMDAGLFRGGGQGYAVGQGVDDFELLRGESEFEHGIVILISG